jgi:hypothetical protein
MNYNNQAGGNQQQIGLVETQPILKRLANVYLNSGMIGLCEDVLNSKQSLSSLGIENNDFICPFFIFIINFFKKSCPN